MRASLSLLIALPLLVLSTGCPTGPSNPCDGVICGPGRCVQEGQRAACICDTTYVPSGLTCVPQTAANTDLCYGNPCGSQGKKCVITAASTAACVCPDGQRDVGGQCVQDSVCGASTCPDLNRNVCLNEGGLPRCLCNPGYTPTGNDCVADTRFDCSKQHSGSTADDAYEPDECPTVARTFTPGSAAQSHTLSPIGDEDWYALDPALDHIFAVSVLAASGGVYLDAYLADGLTTIASDHTGVSMASLRFIAPQATKLYVRVRAASPGTMPSYTISIADLGVDDHANNAVAAAWMSGSSFSGSLQYADDEDWIRASVQAGHAYAITPGALAAGVVVDLVASDGVTVLRTFDGTSYAPYSIRPSAATTVHLHARPTSANALGAYSFTLEDQGLDDHADVATSATLVAVGASNATGSWERTGDADAVKFPVVTGHIYAFICIQNTYGCSVSLYDEAGNPIGQDSAYSAQVTVEAAANATWTAIITPMTSGATGSSYQYRIEDWGTDDYGGSAATAGQGKVGSTSGRIEKSGDIDVLKWTAVAGHTYQVTCSAGTALSSCAVSIYGPTGTAITSSSSGSASFEAASSQTHYVGIQASYTGYTGTYTLTISDLGADDHGDTAPNATPIALGTAAAGSIETSLDHDFFSFTATQSKIYRVTCSTGASYLCAMSVRNPSGTQVASSSYGTSTTATFIAQVGGTFTVDVYPWYSGYTGTYSVTVVEEADDPDSSTGATVLTLGTAKSAGIQFSYDVDWFQFAATSGKGYKVSCTGSSTYMCRMYVYDPAGAQVGYVTNGSSRLISLTAASTGNYTIKVNAYTTYQGSYTITVTEVTDDHGDTAANGTGVTVGAAATSGEIHWDGDLDVFTWTATQDKIYTASCSTSASYLCELSVKGPTGTIVASSAYGTATTASFKASAGGTYSVEVSQAYTGYLGTYTVAVAESTDDHSDTGTGATALTFGTAQAGNLQYVGDKDVFSFSATQSKIYRVVCASSYSVVCALTVKDGSNATVGSATAGTSRTVSFAAASSGTFTVEVSGTGTAAYSLTVTESTDDHGNDVSSGTTLTLATATAGEIQFSGDKDVFKFTGTTDKLYNVVCTTSATGICVLNVKDPSAVLLGSTTSGTNRTVFFKAATTGTFSVEVSGNSAALGTYSLTVTESTDDHGNTSTNATALTAGAASTTGKIDYSGDVDVFTFTTTAKHYYTFNCSSSFWVCEVTIKNASGTTVASQTGGYTSVALVFGASTAGTYTIEVKGYTTSTGTYTYSLADSFTDDHGDSVSTGTSLAVNGAGTGGSIQWNGDTDFFTFSGTSGKIYKVSCTSSTYVCGLSVKSQTGTLIASVSAGYTLDTSAAFKATATETFSVEVTPYSGYTGAYSITVVEVADDHADTYSAATNISAGASISGELEVGGDVDWMAVSLAASTTYTVTTTGGTYIYVQPYMSNGTTPFTTTGGTSRAFTTTTAGTYYIKVYGYYSTTVGTYTVTVQ